MSATSVRCVNTELEKVEIGVGSVAVVGLDLDIVHAELQEQRGGEASGLVEQDRVLRGYIFGAFERENVRKVVGIVVVERDTTGNERFRGVVKESSVAKCFVHHYSASSEGFCMAC